MVSTTQFNLTPTITQGGGEPQRCPPDLLERYEAILDGQRLHWTSHHALLKLLGRGGQGVVYLTKRRGADGFTLPLAIKIFSPERYEDERAYDAAMARIARVAARVAQIQQDNLLDVHNFVDRNRIRIMVMEWIDGFDLSCVLKPEMMRRIRQQVKYIHRVIVTDGPAQPRVKAGVAVAIVRDCLAALAALHRENIVHGDIKPSNIMLKRTGNAKIVDIGSAIELDDPPPTRTITPTYAAPEVLEGLPCTQRSDLASLGYVLIEMLAGQSPFAGVQGLRELLEAKRFLAQRLPQLLPEEVTCNELLMEFCRTLVAPDPMKRFPDAEAAELLKGGAAAFHRQLVKGDLSAEYDNEIRLWIEQLKLGEEAVEEEEAEE